MENLFEPSSAIFLFWMTGYFFLHLGYANEVGEAFRALISVNAVRASYGVAFTYVFADTYDKAMKMYRVSNFE